MNRREFSRTIGLGTVGLGAVTGSVAALAASSGKPKKAGKVDRAHRKEWAKEHFKGLENILIASFTPDLGKLDEAGIRLDVRNSIKHGFFSTLCAPPGLSPAEQKRFMDIAVDEAAGQISVALALHGTSDAERFDLLAHAEKAGVDTILLDLPREGTAEELIAYGRKFATATNLGCYLWMAQVHKFARFHPNGIPYEVFDALADEPNVVGLKVGTPDPAVIFELFARYNDRMLIGSLMPDIMPLTVKSFGQQWSAAWSVEAIQSPEKPYMVEYFKLLRAGKHDEAMKIYWQHVKPGFGMMMKLLAPHMGSGGHLWEHFKYYQFLTGGNGGRYRVDPEYPNLPPVSPEDRAMIRGAYKAIGVPTTPLPDEAFPIGRVNWEKGVRQ